jgi:excisionase family DNA binding protein
MGDGLDGRSSRPVLTPRIAARRAGVSISTIYRLYHEGYLQALRPSRGAIMIFADSLAQHLAQTQDPQFWDK